MASFLKYSEVSHRNAPSAYFLSFEASALVTRDSFSLCSWPLSVKARESPLQPKSGHCRLWVAKIGRSRGVFASSAHKLTFPTTFDGDFLGSRLWPSALATRDCFPLCSWPLSVKARESPLRPKSGTLSSLAGQNWPILRRVCVFCAQTAGPNNV